MHAGLEVMARRSFCIGIIGVGTVLFFNWMLPRCTQTTEYKLISCEKYAQPPTVTERINFYKADIEPCPTVTMRATSGHDDFVCLAGDQSSQKPLFGSMFDKQYIKHFTAAAKHQNFVTIIGDRILNSNTTGDSLALKQSRCPIFVKVRNKSQKNNVIAQLEWVRHFNDVPRVLKMDTTDFQFKLDSAVWYGATTGRVGSQRWHLLQRIENLTTNTRIKMGVSTIVQGYHRSRFRPDLVGGASIESQLQHKMIIDAQGNDVSTGLKWKLASQSAVIMPAPTISSWVMEEHLKPWVHFIPVRQDFKDLEWAVEWCLDHEAECRQIAMNGRCWIQPFLDFELNEQIMDHLTLFATPCN